MTLVTRVGLAKGRSISPLVVFVVEADDDAWRSRHGWFSLSLAPLICITSIFAVGSEETLLPALIAN